jgi:hypothetical protein
MSFFSEFFAVPRAALVAAINTIIGSVGEDGILEIAWTVFRNATQKAILTTIAVIFKTIINAMIGYMGPVDSIWKAIIDNPANQELFETLKKDWWKVACFFVDILEPIKRFVSAESYDGMPPPAASAWNQYNELDLSQAMNRHAVISQVQRFFKSIIEVFRQKDLNVARFDMNTRLETDSLRSVVLTTVLQREEASVEGVGVADTAESWIFVNGIAGEFFWNNLSVQKLQDFFFDPDQPEDTSDKIKSRRTTLTSIFNRSEGIVWDLIECAGQCRPQDTNIGNIANNLFSKPTLSSHTASSREAQGQLSQVLRDALSDSATSKRDIIMIAHSQGCLLLRLTIEQIHFDADSELRDIMHSHLRVYTFGNPAYDWDVHAYTASTEHFANELDYVAKLGVLRKFSSDPNEAAESELEYCSRCRAGDDKHLLAPKQLVFVNNQHQTGHLFGSQYSLQARDYDCVNMPSESRLLSRAWRRPLPPPSTSTVYKTTDMRERSFDVEPGVLDRRLKWASPGKNAIYVCSLAWELKAFVALDLDGDCALEDVLTITGEEFTAFATTCRDWVRMTWGDVGKMVLDATCEAITHGQFSSESVSIYLDGNTGVDERAEVSIKYTNVEKLVAMIETFTWLAATFRPPIENCLSYSSAKARLTDKGIEISLERLVEADYVSSTCCWHRVLGDAIIAKGFRKVNGEVGLGLPFPLMLELTGMMYGTDISKIINDGEVSRPDVATLARQSMDDPVRSDEQSPSTKQLGIFFTGVHSVLYPTQRDPEHNTVKWHYATSNTVITPPKDGTWLRLHETDLRDVAHVLGYTPEVKVMLGTKDRLRRYCNMQASSAMNERDTWSFDWDGITVQAGFSGSGLSFPFKIVRRKAQKAAPSAKPSYDQIVHHTVREPVIVCETARNQGTAWLVPKLSLILDLALFQAKKRGWLEDLDDNARTALFARPHWNGGLAAKEVLDDHGRANTTLALSADDGQPIAVKDLVKDIFTAMTIRTQLDQLYPSPRPIVSRSALLTGWDLLELSNPVRSSRRLQVDLNQDDWRSSTPTWLRFANQISAFFCDNVGDIMESALPLCPASQHDKKHLIANVHVLSGLMTLCVDCEGYHVGTGEKWIWNVPQEDCFTPCDHETRHIRTRDGNCFRDRMQLMRSEDHDCKAHEITSLLPEKGAVVFGPRSSR